MKTNAYLVPLIAAIFSLSAIAQANSIHIESLGTKELVPMYGQAKTFPYFKCINPEAPQLGDIFKVAEMDGLLGALSVAEVIVPENTQVLLNGESESVLPEGSSHSAIYVPVGHNLFTFVSGSSKEKFNALVVFPKEFRLQSCTIDLNELKSAAKLSI